MVLLEKRIIARRTRTSATAAAVIAASLALAPQASGAHLPVEARPIEFGVLRTFADFDFRYVTGAPGQPTGRGTGAGLQGPYCEGALQYVSVTLPGGRRLGGDFFGVGDVTIDAGGTLQLSSGFSVMAGFSTGSTQKTSLSFEAGDVNIDQPEVDVSGAGVADHLDDQSFAVDGSLGHRPVSGLLFAVDAQDMHIDMAEGTDFGGFSGVFRAQRIL